MRPKPMVEIGGMPILWHIMKIYAAHGIDDFVICRGLQELPDQGVLRELLPPPLGRHVRPRGQHDGDARDDGRAVDGDDRRHGRRDHDRRPPHAPCATTWTTRPSASPTATASQTSTSARSSRSTRRQGALATVTAVQPPGRFGALHSATAAGSGRRLPREAGRGRRLGERRLLRLSSPTCSTTSTADERSGSRSRSSGSRTRGSCRLPAQRLLASDGHAAGPDGARGAVGSRASRPGVPGERLDGGGREGPSCSARSSVDEASRRQLDVVVGEHLVLGDVAHDAAALGEARSAAAARPRRRRRSPPGRRSGSRRCRRAPRPASRSTFAAATTSTCGPPERARAPRRRRAPPGRPSFGTSKWQRWYGRVEAVERPLAELVEVRGSAAAAGSSCVPRTKTPGLGCGADDVVDDARALEQLLEREELARPPRSACRPRRSGRASRGARRACRSRWRRSPARTRSSCRRRTSVTIFGFWPQRAANPPASSGCGRGRGGP